MNGQNLRQLYESLGPVGFQTKLQEALETKELHPEDFSLKELAEACCGYDWVKRLNPRNTERFGVVRVQEAGEGVDVSAFAHITGQLFFTKIMEGWKDAGFIGDRLVETIQTQLDGERLPWISNPYDEGEEVHPGEEFPETALGERYVDTPRTAKQGRLLSITKEAIFFDRTGMLLKQAGKLGWRISYTREKSILRAVLGITNTYSLNGSTANTYQTVAGSTPNTYVNAQSGLPLTDYTAFQQYFTLASNVLDPDTNEPIITEPKALLVMPARLFNARRIVNATEVRNTYPGYGASSPAAPGNVQNISGNPIPWNLEVLTSPIAYQLLLANGTSASNAVDYWYVGDFKVSFAWMENWPLQVLQAPAGNIREFDQDLVARFKASYRGAVAVLDPRYVYNFWNS